MCVLAINGVVRFRHLDVPLLIVDLVTEARCINNGERDAGSLVIKLEFYSGS